MRIGRRRRVWEGCSGRRERYRVGGEGDGGVVRRVWRVGVGEVEGVRWLRWGVGVRGGVFRGVREVVVMVEGVAVRVGVGVVRVVRGKRWGDRECRD